ncbi:Rho termination factor N-terminal domain-containing protein [Thermoproteota archaeon]
MKINEIRQKAKQMGLTRFARLKKHEIILKIQDAEGNTQCYGSNNGSCPYLDCCWIGDCGNE